MTPETITARHYQSGLTYQLIIEGGVFQSVEPIKSPGPKEIPWIGPGLIDPQINGFGGVDFNRLPSDAEALLRADRALLAHGCTRYLLTLITHPQDHYLNLIKGWESLRQHQLTGAIGYHLEGPFLNPDPGYCGAHRPQDMRAPDLELLETLLVACHGDLRWMTMAPEVDWPRSLAFIRSAVAKGLKISAGHSALMGVNLAASISAGLSAWTHLGNAAPAQNHKFENVIFHALGSPLPHVFLIPDGIHLPAHVFRPMASMLRERLLLTTDAMAGASAQPGQFTLGEISVEVHADRRATVAGSEKLAGSTLTPFAGVFLAAQMSGLPWSECWDAFSTRTAQWLGLAHGLKPGLPADFCLFNLDPAPQLQETWRKGKREFNR